MTLEEFFNYNYVALFGILFILVALIRNRGLEKRDKKLFFIIAIIELAEFLFYNLEKIVSATGAPSYQIVLRKLFSAFGYSLRPLIIYCGVKMLYKDDKSKWNIVLLIPELIVIFFAFSSFFTGICYTYNTDNEFIPGPLTFIPPVGIMFYFLVMIIIFIKRKVMHQPKEMVQLFIIAEFGIGAMIIDMICSTSISRSALIIATILCLYCTQNFRLVENINLLEENEILRRTVDQLEATKQELETSNQATKKAYDILAKTYLSLHRIDVINNTYETIKTQPQIEQLKLDNTDTYDINIKNIMKYLSKPNYIKTVIEFLDLTNIDERMKDKDYLSYEFEGNINGWCRLVYLKENMIDDRISHIIFGVQVIDAEKRKEKFLTDLANTDQLTQILNRGAGEKLVKERLTNNQSGLFIILDCDHFKSINDTYGHNVGDMVIKELAKALAAACRKEDVVFRLGGDEFAIFANDIVEREEAEKLFSRITANIDKIYIPELKDRKLYVSMGCSFTNSKNNKFEVIYNEADGAMYESKLKKGHSRTFKHN